MCNGVTTRGPWTLADAERHINELELLGAFLALQSYVGKSKGLGTKLASLTSIAKDLEGVCEAQSMSIEACHLPGTSNVVADKESRAVADAGDWLLDRRVCKALFDILKCDVDLFSLAWYAQLTAFVSWRPQPNAMAVNAFSLIWADFVGYLFPHFLLF